MSTKCNRLSFRVEFISLRAGILSHRIGVMNEGRIVQIGSPQEIYEHPANRFVADFVGVTNLLEGTIESECRPQTSIQNGYYYRVQTDLGQITVFASNSHQAGEHTVISIRPQDVHPLTQRPNEDGFWEANVLEHIHVGPNRIRLKYHAEVSAIGGDRFQLRNKSSTHQRRRSLSPPIAETSAWYFNRMRSGPT